MRFRTSSGASISSSPRVTSSRPLDAVGHPCRPEWGAVAPTGRRATFSGVNIFRFGAKGKVVEIWNHRDDLGLMEKIRAPVFAGAPISAYD